MPSERNKRLFFRPFSLLYFFILSIFAISALSFAFLIYRSVFLSGLNLSPIATILIFVASIIGSCLNIPITELDIEEPVMDLRRIRFFGVEWLVPSSSVRRRKTLLTVNVGGALLPLALSVYLLVSVVPLTDNSPVITYAKVVVALLIVSLAVNFMSQPVRGLGIATPSFLPPLATALASIFLYDIVARSNPFIISYVSGSMGTLIGADLLNLRKIPGLGTPVASIGGAGTFDGIFLTGVLSVFLVLFLL